ncbi:PAS domain-containing sensor histidine kinase [Chitinophaga nivalis]|uniref:histidine kinase n=1 Tax=Chitinophaga nivalis TaxID=2991709 RepID=A0ABT3IGD8_9BACT|nr:PAS domain-containing sensor histidine kinase [Chitinophaga nivalis]MCW3467301.1 ATP-binding protein [Chitinophaga nivalis]MCW3483007.1 ATP-binding protein [Chitinophaga nivalis]
MNLPYKVPEPSHWLHCDDETFVLPDGTGEKFYRDLLMESPVAMAIYTGPEMCVRLVNEAMLDIWDKNNGVIGKPLLEAVPELSGQVFSTLLDGVFTTGIPYIGTEDPVRIRRKGQPDIRYYKLIYKPLYNESKLLYGVMSTAVNVTDLVLAREELRETEKLYRNAVDVAELGTWSKNLRTGFVTYSPLISEWYGLPAEACSMAVFHGCIHEADQQRVAALRQQAIDTSGLYDCTFRVVNKTLQKEHILHAKGMVITGKDGQPESIMGMARDITLDRMTSMQLEELVQTRTQALAAANKSLRQINDNLQQFAYIASHDLQEPLRKIITFSGILQKTQAHQDTSGQLYLGKISGAAQRMSHLISDLLDYSRVENSKAVFMPTRLQDILQNIYIDFEVLIHQQHAVIETAPLPEIAALPLQMNQLFYNLIGNALKFTRKGIPPEIKLTAAMLTPEEVQEYSLPYSTQPYTHIVIQDNGVGFDPQFAEEIFLIFHRLHNYQEYEGTGIGLALCRKIVENHGGRIYATSNKEEGAAFHILLPLSRP